MGQLLPFISEEEFYRAVEGLLAAAQSVAEDVEANPYRNVIDPFSALVDSARQRISLGEWMVTEKTRQTQKGFQNAVGHFHQDILGSMPGWENLGRSGGSADIKSTGRKLIAEVKNKYNTMNAGAQESVYQKLAGHLRFGEKGYTAYVVSIIPSSPRPFDKPWSPNKKTMALRDDIRIIDGKSFYALASGDVDALEKVYNALPAMLGKIMGLNPNELSGTNEFSILFRRAYYTKNI